MLNTKLNYTHAHTVMHLVANKVRHKAYYCTHSVRLRLYTFHTMLFTNVVHTTVRKTPKTMKTPPKKTKQNPDETLLYIKNPAYIYSYG